MPRPMRARKDVQYKIDIEKINTQIYFAKLVVYATVLFVAGMSFWRLL